MHDNHQQPGPRHQRGPSSFGMHDADTVFGQLGLQPGQRVLDLGCGPGDYTLEMAARVGESGLVHALDKGRDTVEAMEKRAGEAGLDNVRPLCHDVFIPLPLQDGGLDLCLISTVLHILNIKDSGPAVFPEVRRVLKPGGRLAVIECKKEDQPWGPPLKQRLSPEDVRQAVEPHGFAQSGYTDLGVTYLLQFTAV